MENETAILNPDIKEVEIGTRTLKKIKVYPLSVMDQFKVTDLFTEVLGTFLAHQNKGDASFVAFVIAAIKANLTKILAFLIDEDSELVAKDLTNNQLCDIAAIAYEVNYEVISKKVSGLLKEIPQPKESLLGRPLQPSAESTDTESMTFTENPGNKEE